MKIQKSKFSSKKLIIISLVGLLLIAGSASAYFFLPNKDQDISAPVIGQPAKSDKIQAEQLADDPDTKSTRVNTDPQQPLDVDDTSGKSIIPMVASASSTQDSVFVRGGLNNVVVTEGECYAIFEGPNGKTLKKQTELLQNASTTDCKTIIINRSEFSSGKWTISLQYASSDAQGSSNVIEIEI